MPRPAAAPGTPPSDGPVTLRVLAQYLNLSPASISLVLNQAAGAAAIPRATQERILEAARRFQYRPNTLAQSLRRQQSQTIGVLVPEISEGYASLVLNGIEDRLLQEGYLYFIASHRHRPDLLQEYPRLMMARSIDAFVYVDTPCPEPLPVPVVAVSGHGTAAGLTNIVLNHQRAAYVALQHLHSLGHRRIAVIKGQPFSSDTTVRWRAIRDAAQRLGLVVDPALVTSLDGQSPLPDLGYRATERLLAADRPFTALFAFNDISAIGAIQALRDARRDVPADVSVVGFDDIQLSAYYVPALTTVRQPLRRMGEIAAETVVQRLAQPHRRVKRVLTVDPELVVRASTAAVPGHIRAARRVR